MKALLESTGCALALALLACTAPVHAQASIVDTKHNLSVSGPGPFKATIESRICIFCHTPHRAGSSGPLWNREDSRETYLAYMSSTFGGSTQQPSGSSKLCLSCHDGSIALGAVLSLDSDIEMAAGKSHLTAGEGYIGTNLMDDHPISFHYASSQGGSGSEYVAPSSILLPVHLDTNGMMQCTSCHDAHNNSLGDFLLVSDRFSDLCLSCHSPDLWPSSSHALSAAEWDGSGRDPWPVARYRTVAENACANCHRTHAAGHPERLLVRPRDEQNCLVCHSGHVATLDVGSEVVKPFAHNPFTTMGVHDPAEDPFLMPRHAECQDCHDAHAVRPGSVPAPGVPGPLTGIGGINGSGMAIHPITAGYQLCYKCHGDNNGGLAIIPRQIEQTNTRLEFDPGNPSFHPIEAPGVQSDVPSLIPPLTTASIIACTDCHESNDSPTFGGSGPAGPHGSIFRPLLGANYNTTLGIPESPQAYALCYRCHSRESILDDRSFGKHKEHIAGEGIPCSACHDAHGVSASQGNLLNNSRLINFDISLVSPSPGTGQLWFRDEGFRHGSCMLLCHGEDHDPEEY